MREARRQTTKLVAAARPALEELMDLMTQVRTLQAAIRTARDARNNPNEHTHYNDSPLTVEEFIRIVAIAGDPIALVDLGGRREIRTRTGITSGAVQQLIEDTRVRA
jgi:hypothetical protein